MAVYTFAGLSYMLRKIWILCNLFFWSCKLGFSFISCIFCPYDKTTYKSHPSGLPWCLSKGLHDAVYTVIFDCVINHEIKLVDHSQQLYLFTISLTSFFVYLFLNVKTEFQSADSFLKCLQCPEACSRMDQI